MSPVLAWRAPWTEGSGRLQSKGMQRVTHDWNYLAHTHTHTLCSTPGPRRRELGSVPRSPRSKSSQTSSRLRAGWSAERTWGTAFLHRHPFPWEGQELSIPRCHRTEGLREPVTHQASHCARRVYSLLRHPTCTLSCSLLSILQHLRFSSHCVKEKAKPQRGEATCSGHMNNRGYNEDSSSGGLLILPLFPSVSPPETRERQRLPLTTETSLFSPLLSHLSSSPNHLLSWSSSLWSRLEAPRPEAPWWAQPPSPLPSSLWVTAVSNYKPSAVIFREIRRQEHHRHCILDKDPRLWDSRYYLCFYSLVLPSEI